MKRIFRIFPVFILMVSFACTQQDKEQLEADVMAVRNNLDGLTARANEENLEGMLTYYAKDAEVIKPDGETIRGTETIQAWLQDVFQQYEVNIDNTSKAVVVQGDKAYDRGVYTWDLTPTAGGEKIERKGWYLYIWERQPDQTWQLVKQSWTAEPIKQEEEHS